MMKLKFLLAFIVMTQAVHLVPDAYGSDAVEAKAKVEKSIAELAQLRTEISRGKEPMAAELRRLENEVIELRRTRERMQRMVDNQTVDLATLENQIKAYNDESTYVLNLLSDYYNRVNASLSVAEVALYQDNFLSALSEVEGADMSLFDRLRVQVPALGDALSRSEALLGGLRVEGEAVLPTGQLSGGQFAIMGPVTYFASDDGGNAGIVVRGSSERPTLIEFDSSANPVIASFIASGKGPLPVDPTLGRALAIATAEESLGEHFLKGGLWMYPIAFFAIFATLIALLKIIQIVTTKELPDSDLRTLFEFVQQDQLREAIHRAKSLPGPGARMVALGLQNLGHSKELMEEFLFEVILEEKPRLERGIPFVMLAASVAPLLGLLGTVTGMIETFKLLTLFGTGDAKSLSSGISQALITTEFGLVAAIPSLILAALIGRMAAGKLSRLEKLLVRFSNGVAAIKITQPVAVAAVS